MSMFGTPGKERIGIMGGSFDPVHTGHMIVAQDAIEQLQLSELCFIPAAVPPHKQERKQVASKHRLEMLKRAVGENSRFSVSDIELSRGGVSYTVDTVRSLVDANPSRDVILVVGSDTLVDLHNWYRIDEILRLCKVASFMRPGEDNPEKIKEKIALPSVCRDQLMSGLFETHLVDISSTEIRERVRSGLSIEYLVPPGVVNYIKEYGLFRA